MAQDETKPAEESNAAAESVHDSASAATAAGPAAPAEQQQQRPPAKIEPADAFTLISRTVAYLLLTGLAIYYGFTGNYGVMLPLALVAVLVQYATLRLIRRIREQNKDYIAWRAAQEEGERQRRRAEKDSSRRGAVRP